MPQVLHTITGLNVGGAEIMLTRLVGRMDQAGFPSTVLSLLPAGAMAASLPQRHASLHSLSMQRARPRSRNVLDLRRLVRQQSPDIIHGWMYHGNMAGSLGSLLSFTFAPVIWSVHHTIADLAVEEPKMHRLIRFSAMLSHLAAAICYCSRIAARQHEHLGFNARRSAVIPNGIDTDTFYPTRSRRAHLRATLNIPPERRIIGHFARYHPMKDQVNLVRAVSVLIADGHDVQLVIAGDGHENGPVREAARDLAIDDRVTTLGLRHDVAELLPGLDVFVLSSAWGEAFSLAAGEAMASGVPVVVTDVGDCGWLVGPTGVVVPPREPHALAAGLARLLVLAAEDRQALGAAARERVVNRFSLQRYVERHVSLYEKVLEGEGRRR
ncbi:glycosyltransferase [Chelativorans sp. M5D2P16]|uniref:glycosyltransferase n=1 Tax=Chelativorans sp. M5D2P16 TaxID=3095678 RepID=UPI002ACA9574|nr:glycosyltransferase [Chelativorans sp. M5D2P16]MDZ5698923.1 glycosyltransferase [Chelativorans sp. M5D2P16]